MTTEQTRILGQQAEQAILERVAAAIENELPMLTTEVVLTDTYERVHRVSHPTYLDEPVYLRVTAHAIGAAQARRMFPTDAGLRQERHCKQEAHKGEGRDACGQLLDGNGQCGRANLHTGRTLPTLPSADEVRNLSAKEAAARVIPAEEAEAVVRPEARFDHKTVRKALNLALEVSPGPLQRQGFQRIVSEMSGAAEAPKTIVLALASSMTDGLRYNNWPLP